MQVIHLDSLEGGKNSEININKLIASIEQMPCQVASRELLDKYTGNVGQHSTILRRNKLTYNPFINQENHLKDAGDMVGAAQMVSMGEENTVIELPIIANTEIVDNNEEPINEEVVMDTINSQRDEEIEVVEDGVVNESTVVEEEKLKGQRKKNKKKKNKKNKYKLKDFVGVSSYSQWLIGLKKEDVEKEERKLAKKEKKRILAQNVKKSVTRSTVILSEPLAEILASQGHFDEAQKMYRQLMHKYPEKSSYFAAKIDNLLKNR